MVKRRLHTLTFMWNSMTKDDDTGIFESTRRRTYAGDCSVFLNGKSRMIGVGGVMRTYSYMIIADADILVPVGARVTIEGKEFEVIAKEPFQKHTELWV